MIKRHLQMVIAHPLIAGSGVLFIGSIFTNGFNFLFNLFMSRNLTLSDYGTMASVVSITMLVGLVSGSILPTVVSFAGEYFANGRIDMVRGLFIKLVKTWALFGVIICLLFISFSHSIADFFKIANVNAIFFAGFLLFLGFISIINGALLQAKLDFGFISLMNFVSTLIKLATGVALVFWGYRVDGALLSLILGNIAAYVLTFFPLKFIFDSSIKASHVRLRDLFKYGGPSAIALLGLTSFISTDLLLVKHFFNAEQAGIYAGMSLVGKVIFFFSAPIGSVMFPVIVQRRARQENYTNVFKLATFLVVVPSILLTALYFYIPELVITLFLKNKQFLVIKDILWHYGVFITGYSALYLLVNFFLSINRTEIAGAVSFAAIIQIVLIIFYHSSFLSIISISSFVVFSLLIFLLLYYLIQHKRKKI